MIADDLGSWAAALRFDDLGEHAIHTVRQRMVDTLGCGLGAFDAEPSRAARRLARALAPGPSTVLGTEHRATADVATFVNGTMVRHLDFNDGYLGLEPGHPSDNIPACLAVAEAEGRTRIPNRVTIHLTSGDVVVREVQDAPGGHGTPMTDEQFEEKFTAQVEPLTTAARCRRMLDEIWHVDQTPTVTTLTKALVVS